MRQPLFFTYYYAGETYCLLAFSFDFSSLLLLGVNGACFTGWFAPAAGVAAEAEAGGGGTVGFIPAAATW